MEEPRHYLSHEMRNAPRPTALCGREFRRADLDYSQGLKPGSCFPARAACPACQEVLDRTVPVEHRNQWVEIPPPAPGRDAYAYTVYYADRQVVRIDQFTEITLPYSGDPPLTHIWSQEHYDPEKPYLEHENLRELRETLAQAQDPVISPAPLLAQAAARLQRTLARETHPEVEEHLQKALTALQAFQEGQISPTKAAQSNRPALAQYRQALEQLDLAKRRKGKQLPPLFQQLPALTRQRQPQIPHHPDFAPTPARNPAHA